MQDKPFLRAFVSPAALCAFGLIAALAAVFQFSLRAYVPGSLEPGGLTLDNFTALAKPLYARVFLDTISISGITAICTLILGYPIACALVRVKNPLLKSAILIIVVTPLFLGEVVRTYSWIVVLGNNGFINSVLLKLGLVEAPLQMIFTHFGVVIALEHVTLPAHIDPDYERTAESLPDHYAALSLPGIIAGFATAFA